jgi:hypothetical protein
MQGPEDVAGPVPDPGASLDQQPHPVQDLDGPGGTDPPLSLSNRANTSYVADPKREYVGLWCKRFILGEWRQAEGAVFDMFDEDQLVTMLPAIERWISLGIDRPALPPEAMTSR